MPCLTFHMIAAIQFCPCEISIKARASVCLVHSAFNHRSCYVLSLSSRYLVPGATALAFLNQRTMGGSSTSEVTIHKALELAKNTDDSRIPATVTAVLEKANTDIWQRIQSNPSSYVMKSDEYAVINYFQGRYKNNRQAQQAIARFWDHYKGDKCLVNDTLSPSQSN